MRRCRIDAGRGIERTDGERACSADGEIRLRIGIRLVDGKRNRGEAVVTLIECEFSAVALRAVDLQYSVIFRVKELAAIECVDAVFDQDQGVFGGIEV